MRQVRHTIRITAAVTINLPRGIRYTINEVTAHYYRGVWDWHTWWTAHVTVQHPNGKRYSGTVVDHEVPAPARGIMELIITAYDPRRS